MVSSSNDKDSPPIGELILAGTWLTCAVLLALPATLWWAFGFAGRLGMAASSVAAGLCWAASLVALWVRMRFPRPQEVVVGTLGAMLVRMVLILGGGILIATVFPQLVQAAFWGQVVVYFLLTLTVEALLAVRWVKKLEASAPEDSDQQSSLSENHLKAI